MSLSSRNLFAPLAALLVLVSMLYVTLGALRSSGAWHRLKTPAGPAPINPYAPLDRVLAARGGGNPAAPIRDPFAYGGAVAVTTPVVRPRPVRPAPPSPPVLTSIVWDADPRATIRWNGRDYSVRQAALFDEFRVVSIARDYVVLDRGGENLVLRLPPGQR